MPRSFLTFGGLALTVGALIYGAAERADARNPALLVQGALRTGIDTFDARLGALQGAPPAERRAAFRAARTSFKRLEGVLSYYAPPLVETLSSTESQDLDDDQASGYKTPRGFQLVELHLFGSARDTSWTSAAREIANMRLALSRFRPSIAYVAPTADEVADLVRLEVARVSTLGITGFDAPLSKNAIAECADALSGVERLVPAIGGSTAASLNAAMTFLQRNTNFDTFDRFTFVRAYVTPAFRDIANARRRLIAPTSPHRRVWPDSVANIYDARALNVMAYAPPASPAPTPELIARGRALFFDASLSGTGRRSCASCHMPAHGFSDGLRIATPLEPGGPKPARHTPTLINAALQPAQFADERRATLEEQIGDVLANPAEMRATPAVAQSREVRQALASYVRSLTAFNSRFDRAILSEHDDTLVFGVAERRGFNLFMGRAGCGTCHFAPLFGGTVPPSLTTSDAEVIGVPRVNTPPHPAPRMPPAVLDPDLGRGAIDRREGMAHAFKTPTVRNAAITAPYMHNGALATLDDVLDFYDRGGGAGAGLHVPNQTLASEPLHLTTAERHDLLAFLRALTDTVHTSPH